LLGQAGKGNKEKDDKGKKVQYLGPLPLGSWFILGNCVIYGFTSRMDKVAIKAGGKVLYNGCNRLLMAATLLGSASTTGSLTSKSAAAFAKPDVAALLFGIIAAETIYMLCLYEAMVTISPVYVTAIKRGGGVLVSSLAGIVLFGENLEGRTLPISIIVAAVVMLVM
jgi:multidrug transporter EmrE-like cation transporter